ncbi:sigma-70 family RNA polymerase sigma factor [Cyanobium sp. Morenito 9A2]|uniref:sigma-70 family RNA polymerase sigma factor n=1 Tax=Cyanobium sp. Morenito 9A2 TaxID=2823718 RepID=UPI0020CDFB55|nr:sigma-70 family RNA polymerase sigma factor [Cyanobium sp. Morenito 9A2]MCP9850058.1 sigma-70 family RNA polymerase sigma factor [Cyanobium sp. Morenito 9A2]
MVPILTTLSSASSRPARPLSRALQERNQRVEHYRGIVRPIALHYASVCSEQADDLQQVGLLGLIRAAELYQRERAIPFAAFARPHIRGAILHYLRDVAPSVRLPRRQQELADRVRATGRQLTQELGRTPSDDQLRQVLGLSVQQWQRFEQACCLRRVELLEHDPAIAAEPVAPGEPEQPPRALLAMAELEPRQGRVVRAVVLGGASLREVARELEVSPMTAHRLLHRGLDQLRQVLRAEPELTPGRFAARAC